MSEKTASPEYYAWSAMKHRCFNKRYKKYHRYGGRGITVCEQWVESFDCFLRDVGKRPTPEHSLDRIKSDGNYAPGNVRWATARVQQNNRTNNPLYVYLGKTVTLPQAIYASGNIVTYFTARSRILRDGWSVTLAVETPALKTFKRVGQRQRAIIHATGAA